MPIRRIARMLGISRDTVRRSTVSTGACGSRIYLAPKVLIIDEFGVWPYDRIAARALFTLISTHYERGSIILTSNKGFAEWGDVLDDNVVATAIPDRLLHTATCSTSAVSLTACARRSEPASSRTPEVAACCRPPPPPGAGFRATHDFPQPPPSGGSVVTRR